MTMTAAVDTTFEPDAIPSDLPALLARSRAEVAKAVIGHEHAVS
jgi:hypothetical protein